MPYVKCEKCGTIFEATGSFMLEVLTGGKDCPECKAPNGVCLIIAVKKH
jgi:hypothetical protein